MDISTVFQQLGIALGLGLLVGLQREHAASRLAGVRTFPLITLLGAVCAMLGQAFGGWVIAAGLIALAGIVVIGNIAKFREGTSNPGLTTEVAILLMFGVGAYTVTGFREAAIAIGAGVAVLLQFKGQLHGIAARFGDDDLKAIMQFALISLIILPVLPNRTYDPYSVLNPRHIWLMVVLIVGISLGGYIAYKFFGEKAGLVLGGILGGLISSTATTVSYARRTAETPESSRAAAIAIMIASTVVFARVLLEIAVVAPALLPAAGPPILIMLATFAVVSTGAWFWSRKEPIEMASQENPSELRTALLFGLIYAVVLFAVAAARERFAGRALYVVAGLSGLTDVDAITLSISRLFSSGNLDADDGWRLIVVAVMSNLIFKGIVVAALGHRNLLIKIAFLYGMALAVGALLLILW